MTGGGVVGPIGFVGLGRMGAPMASRLARARHRVIGFDRDQAAAARAADAGLPVVSGLVELGHCGIVILMVPSSAAVEQAVLAPGLLATMAPGSLILDMSSSEPASTRRLAETARVASVDFVDAPMSGGVAGAELGTLTAMVGGPTEAVDRVRPLLDVMASRVIRTGEVGSGHATKALNNLMSATHLLVTSEALLAADAFGLELDRVLEAINESSGRSGSTQNKWPNFVLPGTFDSGFDLTLMLKDMRIALSLEDSMRIFSPLSRASVDLWAEAADELPVGADHTEIVRWLKARSSTGSDVGLA